MKANACWGVALVLAMVGASFACTNDDGTDDASGEPDAAADSGSGVDSGNPATNDAGGQEAGGGACGALSNDGAQVAESAGTGERPEPQGGTIEEGVYVLTKHEVYPPSSPDENTRKRTFRFAAGEFAFVSNDGTKPEVRISGTFAASGSEVGLSATCPKAESAAIPYTAGAGVLVMFDKASPNDVYTYTKP